MRRSSGALLSQALGWIPLISLGSPGFASDLSATGFLTALHWDQYRFTGGTPSVDLQWLGKGERNRSIFWKTDLKGGILLGSIQDWYLTSSETYLSWQSEGQRGNAELRGVRVSLGRKLEDWSALDQVWALGMTEPRLRWNPFKPERLGNIGLFVEHRSDALRGFGFVSPLFLPEQGAPIRFENGIPISGSPFFTQPPLTMPLFSTEVPIRYYLATPPIRDVLFRPGGGFGIRLEPADGLFWLQSSYLYGPASQFQISYDAALDLNENGVRVDLYPEVIYRHSVGVDLGVNHRMENSMTGKSWVSLLTDFPIQNPPPESRNISLARVGIMASVGTELRILNCHDLTLSYLHSVGGIGDEKGPLPVAGGAIFDTRFPFRRAGLLGWQSPVKSWGGSTLLLRSQTIYDFSVEGFWAQPEAKLNVGRDLSFTLGADVLVAARKEALGIRGGDFIGRNQKLDRIRWAMQVAF